MRNTHEKNSKFLREFDKRMLTLNVKQIIGLRRCHKNGILKWKTSAAVATKTLRIIKTKLNNSLREYVFLTSRNVHFDFEIKQKKTK